MSAAPAIDVALHVWTLDVDADERDRLSRCLTTDEAARAARFIFDHDRERFIVARGRLREFLAQEIGCAPAAVAFAYAPHGKPSIKGASFNLSHSGATAALAISRHVDIGVDIEYVRPLKEDVASTVFSKRELADLAALPESERLDAFYRGWTRKEAIIKAIGEGLSHRLDSFDVSLGVEHAPLVGQFEGEADGSRVWRMISFQVAPDCPGAIACRTGGAPLVVDWQSRL